MHLFFLVHLFDTDALRCIADFASALAIELRRAPLPDARDFLRFMFRNGSEGTFEPVHVFGHESDIPLTEFVFRTRVSFRNFPVVSSYLSLRVGLEVLDEMHYALGKLMNCTLFWSLRTPM